MHKSGGIGAGDDGIHDNACFQHFTKRQIIRKVVMLQFLAERHAPSRSAGLCVSPETGRVTVSLHCRPWCVQM